MQISAQHLAEVIEAIKKRESQGDNSDKRRFARIAIVTQVEVLSPATGQTYAALTRDLCLEGIGLIQGKPMRRGEVMTISLPRAKGVVVAQCQVAHARALADGVWGVGATFMSVTATGTAPSRQDAAEAGRIASRMLG